MFEGLSLFHIGVVIASILIGMSVHEAMHSFVAYWLGDDTAKDEGRLSFNPLRHIDPITTIGLPLVMVLFGLPPILAAKPVPFDPRNVRWGEYGSALIAIAGPISNFILAAIAALLFRTFGADLSYDMAYAMFLFIIINISLFLFNMLPVPPLDGSRLLYAFAPEPLQRVMRTIEAFGLFAILAFVLLLMPIIGPYYSDILQSVYNFLM